MAKKYVFSSIMIVSAILAIISFIFPYYRVDFNDPYVGSISISGISFMFGLGTTNTGYFLDKTISVIPQVIVLVIAIISLILLILGVVSLVHRTKDSVLFFSLNIFSGIASLVNMFLTIFFIRIAYVSMASPTLGLDPTWISNETLSYGAIIGIVFLAVFALFSLVLAFVSFYDYRMSLKTEDDHKFYYGPTLNDYSANKIGYEDKKEIEQKYSNKFLGFFKKEEKKEDDKPKEIDYSNESSNASSSSNTRSSKPNKPSSPYERDLSKETSSSKVNSSSNPHGVKTRTGVFDINYKDAIDANNVNKKSNEKSLDEMIADLDKLYQDHMIGKEDYEKYKSKLMEKYGNK